MTDNLRKLVLNEPSIVVCDQELDVEAVAAIMKRLLDDDPLPLSRRTTLVSDVRAAARIRY